MLRIQGGGGGGGGDKEISTEYIRDSENGETLLQKGFSFA